MNTSLLLVALLSAVFTFGTFITVGLHLLNRNLSELCSYFKDRSLK